jgi:putative flippase GtrA
MRARFSRYFSVGIVNTAIHWALFLALQGMGLSQWASNGLAFLVAVTFSFYANAKVTFQARATPQRYAVFVLFMGCLSVLVGVVADRLQLFPLVTLVVFSGLSLVVGFLFSQWFVFRRS